MLEFKTTKKIFGFLLFFFSERNIKKNEKESNSFSFEKPIWKTNRGEIQFKFKHQVWVQG